MQKPWNADGSKTWRVARAIQEEQQAVLEAPPREQARAEAAHRARGHRLRGARGASRGGGDFDGSRAEGSRLVAGYIVRLDCQSQRAMTAR